MQQHEPQSAVAEKTATAASAPAAALATTVFAAAVPAVTIAFATAAPSMASTTPFVAEFHFVQIQRASAHEIAT
ncbi:hypothetical protein [Pandoraea pnomenusa]|uniref:hypothetical protein n=1 Tax=Pandoraea pnomenusa TaxID=93220 RepID=UPI003341509C